jgi:AraC family transcriptional regulator of adaptative response/methylated-DNA-[protein]-cysteine methyltransferase
MICMPDTLSELAQAQRDYARIERAIRFICARRERQPDLAEIATSVHLSEYHFQRLFQRWAGITPKRFLQFLTKEHAKERLRDSASVLEAALSAGLSGPGRLHDLLVECEAVTPGQYRRGGEGIEIRYGYHATRFGQCLLAATARGVCALRFVEPQDRGDELQAIAAEWPRARLVADQSATSAIVARIFRGTPAGAPLSLHLKGTNFQLKVWEALLAVPEGTLVGYAALAKAIGAPQAARAVGGAIAKNPVAWLIPCHRVLRSLGEVGGYRWGPERKLAMLGWEAARADQAAW